jgi:ABC-2 type transport system permease protein
MSAEFKHSLRRRRGQIVGWSIGLAIYSLMMVFLYDSLTQLEGMEELFEQYPPELMAFFGGEIDILSAKGYMQTYFFSYMSIIIGIFGVTAGAGMLASDEEKGIMDLIISYPVSRTGLFWGRWLALLMATIIILMVGFLSWAIPMGSTTLDLTWLELLLPFLPLFAVVLLFATLALLLSMVLPSARASSMISAALMVANFLLLGLATLNDALETLVKFTPLYYYQGAEAMDGLNLTWLGGLLGVSLLMTLVAWILVRRRDIRVGGEQGWQLPKLRGARQSA